MPLDFSNTELAFRAKSDSQLKKATFLYSLMGNPLLAKLGPKAVELGFQLQLPITAVVKSTLFDIFCGGVSIEDTVPTSTQLYKYGVSTILDYSVEGEETEQGFDLCRNEIVRTLQHGGKTEAVAFTACKITGLGRFDLLAKAQTEEPLSAAETQELAAVWARIDAICAASVANHTPVFIDAEESWIQTTIDRMAEAMMEKYNATHPWVFTTVQLYRHDRLAYLTELLAQSAGKYIPGVKLVRGAYHEKEAARAAEMGYQNPIQPNKAATDRDYDAALQLCMAHIERVAICAGTHNEGSSQLLTELMATAGLAANHPHIIFAQLLGMSDNLSFNLAAGGYHAAKYLPYGPVKSVIPYLMRRAQENSSVAGQTGRELIFLRQEMKRRKL